jgi:type II secretory pathway pseudopilin PulG
MNRISARRRMAGFTMAELLVTLGLFSIVVIGMLALFDMNSRIARVEGHTSEMQQSLRIAQQDLVRNVRMAARGGLPSALFADGAFTGKELPLGLAVEVANNVPANTQIAGDPGAPVLAGTDVITIRGIFSTLYQSNPAGAGLTLIDVSPMDGTPEGGSLILSNVSPTGVPQDLSSVAKAIEDTTDARPEAYLLVSPLDDAIFAVVEILTSSTVSRSGTVITSVTLNFNASESTNDFASITPGGKFPKTMTTVAYSGVLEEYRYYIRDQRTGTAQEGLEPRLARARLYPGTNTPYEGLAVNLQEDIADNVFDLQVALGVDTNGDESITEGTDTATRRTDEWLFNEVGDNAATKTTWNGDAATPRRLYYVRLTTLARTDRRDPQPNWQSPALSQFEDKDFTQAPYNAFNSTTERKFRRQFLQTVVDLRNLS